MTKIKYNPSIMSTTFKKVVQDANKEINIAYNKAISIKTPIGFSNSADLTNSINILRMCQNDLQNYLHWIDDIKRNFEDVSNSSIAEVNLIDKIKIPVTEKVVKKQ